MGKVLSGKCVFRQVFFQPPFTELAVPFMKFPTWDCALFYLEAGVYYKTTFHSETGIFLFKYSYYNIWVIH